MRDVRVVAGAILGASLFIAAAAFVSAHAMAPSNLIIRDQNQCGGICGTGWSCSNASCPRCLADNNGNTSCSS
jgi:hypothetical protein